MPSDTSIWPGPVDGTHRALGARECRVVVGHVGSCWNQERDRPDLSPQSQRVLRERSDGTRPGAWDGACPSPRSQPGTRAGDADDEIRGYERDEPLRSVLEIRSGLYESSQKSSIYYSFNRHSLRHAEGVQGNEYSFANTYTRVFRLHIDRADTYLSLVE